MKTKSLIVYTPMLLALLNLANAQSEDPVDPIPPASQPEEQGGSKAEDIGFTWWNDVPELLQRGNRSYFDGDFETAEDYYQNADLKDRDRGEVPLNLGLSRAQQGNMRGAIYSFEDAQRLAGEDKELASESAYNRGVAHLKRADELQELMSDPDSEAGDVTEELLSDLFSAVDAFDEAMELREGEAFEDAELNKLQAQHRIQMNSQIQQMMQQQQQQSEDGEEGEEGQQGQEGESGEPNDQTADGEQQQSGDQQQEGQQGQNQDQADSGDQQEEQEQQPNEQGQDEQEQQEQQQAQGEPSESEGGEGGQAQASAGDQLTEEQARELLNLVKDGENVKLRKAKSRNKPLPKKDW